MLTAECYKICPGLLRCVTVYYIKAPRAEPQCCLPASLTAPPTSMPMIMAAPDGGRAVIPNRCMVKVATTVTTRSSQTRRSSLCQHTRRLILVENCAPDRWLLPTPVH